MAIDGKKEAAAIKAGVFRQCSTTGCLHRAQWAPEIVVPPKGFAVDYDISLKAIVGIPLCQECMDGVKPEQFLNPGMVQVFCQAARMKGPFAPPPDFTRMDVMPVPLDGIKYRDYLLRQKKH